MVEGIYRKVAWRMRKKERVTLWKGQMNENESVCMKEGNFGLIVVSFCERQHNAVMMCSSGDPSQPLHECHVAWVLFKVRAPRREKKIFISAI